MDIYTYTYTYIYIYMLIHARQLTRLPADRVAGKIRSEGNIRVANAENLAYGQ